jgi:hypothetical protein
MAKLKNSELQRELAAIEKKHNGRLTPEMIVEEAGDPASRLHDEFDWDDRRCALEHRKSVARALLRRVEYVAVDVEETEVTAVAYIHEPGVATSSYIHISQLIKDEQRAAMFIRDEFTRAESALRRTQRFADILNLRDDVDEMLADYINKSRRITSKVDRRQRGRRKPSAAVVRRKPNQAKPHARERRKRP